MTILARIFMLENTRAAATLDAVIVDLRVLGRSHRIMNGAIASVRAAAGKQTRGTALTLPHNATCYRTGAARMPASAAKRRHRARS